MHKKNSIKLCSMFALAVPTIASSQETTQLDNQATSLDTVIVTATKTEATVTDVPQAVSVLDYQDLEQINPGTVTEALDWMPGVRVGSSNPYLAQPSIRGLSRGRVVISVDGVNQTVDSNKGMELSPFNIDPYLIRQIEVQKGSSSVLYGSGGMGGVIAIETKNVEDLLEDGNSIGGFIRPQYDNLNKRFQTSLGVYGTDKQYRFDWMLTGTAMKSDSSEDGVTLKNNSRKLNAKLGWNIDDAQRLGLQLGTGKRKYVSEVVVDPDIARDNLVKLSYDVERGDYIDLKSSLSYNQVEREASMVNALAGKQDTKVKRWQFDIQNTQRFGSGISHELTYGLNSYRISQSGTVNGMADSFIAPAGTRTEIGIFAQDRIDWSNLTVIGALRYNYYKMDSDDNPDVTENTLLPSIGATYHATDWLALHANYSHDFRAPSIDDLYTTAYGLYPGMDIIANPDLKPESSRNKEVGFTLHHDGLFGDKDSASLRLSYFDQDITDMITLDNLGLNTTSGNIEFGSINKASVDRRGVELEARYRNENLSLSLATDYLREEDNDDGSVSRPARTLKLRTSYTFPDNGITLSWLAKAASKHEKSDGSGYYRGYMVHDLRFDWENAFGLKELDINAGVDNVFDREYHNYFGAEGAERHFRIGFLAHF